MLYLSALSAVVGIVSGFISIYEFIKARQRPSSQRTGFIFGVVTICLLLGAVIFASLPSGTSHTDSGSSSTPTSQNPTGGQTTSCTYCTPNKTLDTYCSAVEQRDTQTENTLYTERLRNSQAGTTPGSPPTTCTHSSLGNETNTTTSASVFYCYNFQNNSAGTNTFTASLIKDSNNDWKIDKLDGGGTIVPTPGSQC
ncbi:MAG: hypothetical protein NVS4B11_18800 [Ktedonobacteraceae bacterium]